MSSNSGHTPAWYAASLDAVDVLVFGRRRHVSICGRFNIGVWRLPDMRMTSRLRTPAEPLDEEALQRLRSLGYVR